MANAEYSAGIRWILITKPVKVFKITDRFWKWLLMGWLVTSSNYIDSGRAKIICRIIFNGHVTMLYSDRLVNKTEQLMKFHPGFLLLSRLLINEMENTIHQLQYTINYSILLRKGMWCLVNILHEKYNPVPSKMNMMPTKSANSSNT